MSKTPITKSSGNVFADLGFSPEEAVELKMRAELMRAVTDAIRASGETQKEIARRLGVTQPRVSNLLNERFELFNLETLIGFAVRLGLDVHLSVEHAA